MFNFVLDERFRKPFLRTKLEEFGRSWASDTSRSKWCWVLRVFEDWRKARNKLILKKPYLGEAVDNKALSSMSNEDLNKVLEKFVAKCRRKDKKNALERQSMK